MININKNIAAENGNRVKILNGPATVSRDEIALCHWNFREGAMEDERQARIPFCTKLRQFLRGRGLLSAFAAT
ncbi:hypothetical protein JS73_10290 [Synergistes jonesii]|uniref:Uncharacterized protein n=1 Tax=Synergistes jonesii TaxID=2754 RepID=A0A073IQ90_9BACT|nr:hypothetical protein EH55_08195 [Synergistes jonesii]OFB60871.1 hypothetical protein JS73_10290 [Synergistes jonesii]OFB61830.1 hypothetical protein JS79_10440 [Synergistes jonesii]OFB62627.1 hypothetical protein JS72_07860 [Synergistes jonesii]OFB66913.1 hypothetical protein JS78_10315 [Synergistes jonesii]